MQIIELQNKHVCEMHAQINKMTFLVLLLEYIKL